MNYLILEENIANNTTRFNQYLIKQILPLRVNHNNSKNKNKLLDLKAFKMISKIKLIILWNTSYLSVILYSV